MPRELMLTPEGGLGVVGAGAAGAPTAALRGVARSASLGLSEPILAAVLKGTDMDTALEASSRQNPMTEEVSGLAGMFSPGVGGKLAKTLAGEALPAGASTLAKALKLARGAGTASAVAGTFGAAEEAGKEIREGNASPGGIAEKGIESAIDPKMILLGALGEAARVPKATEQMKQAKQVQGSHEKMADILQPTGQKEQAAWVEARDNGNAHDAISLIANEGKAKSLKEFRDNAAATQEKLGKAVDDIVNIDPDRPMPTDSIMERGARAAKNLPAKDAEKVMAHLQDNYSEPMTLKQMVNEQRALNKKNSAILSRAGWVESAAEAEPEYIANDIARREMSKAIDATVKELTGTDQNAYRDYGKVSEISNQLQKRYNRLSTGEDVRKGRGIIGEITSSSRSETLLPGKESVIKNAISALTGGELGRINKQVERLFNRPDIKPRAIASAPGAGVEEARNQRIESEKDLKKQADAIREKIRESATDEDLNKYRNEMADVENKMRINQALNDLRTGAEEGASKEMEQIAREKQAQVESGRSENEPATQEDLQRHDAEVAEAKRQIKLRQAMEDLKRGATAGAGQRMGAIYQQYSKKVNGMDTDELLGEFHYQKNKGDINRMRQAEEALSGRIGKEDPATEKLIKDAIKAK